MISATEIAQVTCAERQDPAVMLPGGSGGMAPQAGSRRLRPARLFRVFSAACAAFLLAWIVYLGATLPAQAVAHEWRLAWVGMDVAEAAGLLVVTWAARRLLEMLIPAAIVTGTVLVCDAWFDVILSWGSSNWRWSVLSALAVELPLAALLFAAARQMIRTTVARPRARMAMPGLHPPCSGRLLRPSAQCPNRPGRSLPPRRTAHFCSGTGRFRRGRACKPGTIGTVPAEQPRLWNSAHPARRPGNKARLAARQPSAASGRPIKFTNIQASHR